jgi:hypothetical protein
MTITYHQQQEVIEIPFRSTSSWLTCLLTPSCPIKDCNRGKVSFMHLG